MSCNSAKRYQFGIVLTKFISIMELTIYSFSDDEGDGRSMVVLSDKGRFFSNYKVYADSLSEFINEFERGGKGIVSMHNASGNFITMAHMLSLDEFDPVRSVYSFERAYGGPEEGGWHYNHYTFIRVLEEGEEFVEEERNSWEDREVIFVEPYMGRHETKVRPYYC
jgi:hypothetical protein